LAISPSIFFLCFSDGIRGSRISSHGSFRDDLNDGSPEKFRRRSHGKTGPEESRVWQLRLRVVAKAF